MSMPTHCVLLLDLEKNEQNLMEKLSKVKSNFYLFIHFFFSKKKEKNVVEVLYTVDPPRLDLLFAGQL